MPSSNQANRDDTTYYFVDESGDSTFFDTDGNYIVGMPGCSPILILGFITTTDPNALRRAVAELHREIAADEYLKDIPSIRKTYQHFHAKDDCPEVREKVFKLLKTLAFKAEFVVARKRLDVFTKRHRRDENIFYNEIVARLFERKLHQAHNVIYFSKRGSQSRQHHFQSAIQTALLNFERKHQRTIETETKSVGAGADYRTLSADRRLYELDSLPGLYQGRDALFPVPAGEGQFRHGYL